MCWWSTRYIIHRRCRIKITRLISKHWCFQTKCLRARVPFQHVKHEIAILFDWVWCGHGNRNVGVGTHDIGASRSDGYIKIAGWCCIGKRCGSTCLQLSTSARLRLHGHKERWYVAGVNQIANFNNYQVVSARETTSDSQLGWWQNTARCSGCHTISRGTWWRARWQVNTSDKV